MGAVGYARHARAADLGNGVVFYATVGIAAAVLTVAAFGLALTRGTSETACVLPGAGAGNAM
jgi:purine-cytosine permease-like protein